MVVVWRIFRKSLRYQPLTLTTLAALAPKELGIELTLIDEGIQEIPDRLEADLVGLTLHDVPADHRVNVRLSEIDGRDEIVVEPRNP